MYFGFYTCITKLIHVFQILHVYYRTYTCLTELILVYRTLILVLQILYLFYRYESTLRYHWTYTCFTYTGVPVGTKELNHRQEYP